MTTPTLQILPTLWLPHGFNLEAGEVELLSVTIPELDFTATTDFTPSRPYPKYYVVFGRAGSEIGFEIELAKPLPAKLTITSTYKIASIRESKAGFYRLDVIHTQNASISGDKTIDYTTKLCCPAFIDEDGYKKVSKDYPHLDLTNHGHPIIKEDGENYRYVDYWLPNLLLCAPWRTPGGVNKSL